MIFLDRIRIDVDRFPVNDMYPFHLKMWEQTPEIEFKNGVTFFCGENGSGKSTLLKAIAQACGIHIWSNETGIRFEENPHEGELYRFIKPKWNPHPVPGSFFSSRIFSDFSRNLEEWAINDQDMLGYFGGKSLITQSHGQSLMAYFRSRYQIKGIYFLDEPETALSPRSLIDLFNLLNKLGRESTAQFIVATHSPFLLACPDAYILQFEPERIMETTFEETDYNQLYKKFLTDPSSFIRS